jgi:hypothetical protein
MKLCAATFSLLFLSPVLGFAPNKVSRTSTALKNDLFKEPSGDKKNEMSKALPFVKRPKLLDGTLAGDVGFE